MAAADPRNPQSWNRYAYVGGTPLTATDPLGLDSSGQNGTVCYTDVVQCTVLVTPDPGCGGWSCDPNIAFYEWCEYGGGCPDWVTYPGGTDALTESGGGGGGGDSGPSGASASVDAGPRLSLNSLAATCTGLSSHWDQVTGWLNRLLKKAPDCL